VNVLVMADTHLRGDGAGELRRWLPPAVERRARWADVILHAGDVVDGSALDRLVRLAPVHAVLGNNDLTLAGRLPEILQIDLGGVLIGMVHDSGPAQGREARLNRRFPDCAVVVFGHSHVPVDAPGVGGQLLFNPGSPTQRRRQPVATFGEIVVADGRIRRHRIIEVEGPQPRLSRPGS
jgi:putative phosphoesterase